MGAKQPNPAPEGGEKPMASPAPPPIRSRRTATCKTSHEGKIDFNMHVPTRAAPTRTTGAPSPPDHGWVPHEQPTTPADLEWWLFEVWAAMFRGHPKITAQRDAPPPSPHTIRARHGIGAHRHRVLRRDTTTDLYGFAVGILDELCTLYRAVLREVEDAPGPVVVLPVTLGHHTVTGDIIDVELKTQIVFTTDETRGCQPQPNPQPGTPPAPTPFRSAT